MMGRLGMPLSADTLIRRVKRAARWSALPRVIRVLALLSKVRAELTSQQALIVDTLKRQCPGFAVMRKLVFARSCAGAR